METRLLRMPDVVRRIGLSRPTIYRMIKAGEFPRPVRQGRTSAWPSTEIDSYVNRCVKKRDFSDLL